MSTIKQHILTADGYTLCTAPGNGSEITAWVNRYDQTVSPQVWIDVASRNAVYEMTRFLNEHLPQQDRAHARHWVRLERYAVTIVVGCQVQLGVRSRRRWPRWAVVGSLAAALLLSLFLAARAGLLPRIADYKADGVALIYGVDGDAAVTMLVENRGLLPLWLRVADVTVYDQAGTAYTTGDPGWTVLFLGQTTTVDLNVPLLQNRAVERATIAPLLAPPATATFPPGRPGGPVRLEGDDA